MAFSSFFSHHSKVLTFISNVEFVDIFAVLHPLTIRYLIDKNINVSFN